MKKAKKLANILLATTFGVSFGFSNRGYSQANKEYYIGNPQYTKSEENRIDEKTYNELLKKGWSILYSSWEDNHSTLKYYIVPENKPPATQGKYSSSTYQVSPNKTITEKKYTPNTYKPAPGRNINYYTPNNSNKNSELGKELLTGAAILGGVLILNELFKPRQKNDVYPTQLIDKSPAQLYIESKNSEWDWQNKKLGEVKGVDENFWEDFQKENAQKKAEAEKRANERSRELSDFVEKQIEDSPETKKWFDEEAKKADKFYNEYCKVNPETCTKIQKMDKLHKIIGYNAYQTGKNYTPAGPVMEGIEISDEIEEKGIENFWKEEIKRADKFFKEKGMNPGEAVKYKVIGTVEMGPNGKLIKKESQLPAREITSEEKVILYYVYTAIKNYTPAGPVMEGMEKYDEIKKEGFWWDK